MKKILSIALLSCMSLPCFAEFEETLPVWSDGKAPETFEQMWSGFDPHREPLEVELLEEWEEDGVILKVVRYRIGVFKGKKAMMAAIYGYPKGGKDLPGLVQMHGGGQSADPRAVVTNAKRGYATISIAWAGRLDTPMYKVDNEHREAFWQDERTSPQYRVTTDWGASMPTMRSAAMRAVILFATGLQALSTLWIPSTRPETADGFCAPSQHAGH